MQIKYTLPPNFEEIKSKFEISEDQHIFYTYGDCIYSPGEIIPPVDVIRHEEIHAEQQSHSDDVAKLWWKRYLHDPDFRIAQESEAYGAQYRFLCQHHKDKNIQARYLHRMAQVLSGPIYGNCTNYSEAAKQIKAFANHGHKKLSTP